MANTDKYSEDAAPDQPPDVLKAVKPDKDHSQGQRNQQFWLAVGVFTMMMAALVLLFFVPIPLTNKDPLTFFLGALTGIAGTCAAFWFPGTASSAKKDDTIANLAAKTAPTDLRTTVTQTTEVLEPSAISDTADSAVSGKPAKGATNG